MAFGEDVLGLIEPSQTNEIDLTISRCLGNIACDIRVPFTNIHILGGEPLDPKIGTDEDPIWMAIKAKITDPEWREEGHRARAAEAVATAPKKPHKDDL